MEGIAFIIFNAPRYPMVRASRSMTARDQFLAMAFAQITFREGLRDIEARLNGSSHLYAMGIRDNITRTNLAYANEFLDWRVYEALARVLIRKARGRYAEGTNAPDIEEMVYAVDASTIDLCLSMFPWATFRRIKAAIKLHTQIDLKGSIPVFISITDGSGHDVRFLDRIRFEAESIYVFDRGYIDFKRLYAILKAGAFFDVSMSSTCMINFNLYIWSVLFSPRFDVGLQACTSELNIPGFEYNERIWPIDHLTIGVPDESVDNKTWCRGNAQTEGAIRPKSRLNVTKVSNKVCRKLRRKLFCA